MGQCSNALIFIERALKKTKQEKKAEETKPVSSSSAPSSQRRYMVPVAILASVPAHLFLHLRFSMDHCPWNTVKWCFQ